MTLHGSEKTKEWREKYTAFIEIWRKKMEELRVQSYENRWTQDRYEMEVTQAIENQILRDVFIFAKNYIAKYKKGKFRNLVADMYEEIIRYGVVEPSRLNFLKKTIENVRRKMK